MMTRIMLLALLVAALSAPVSAQDLNLAVVDMDRVILNSKAGEQMRKEMDELLAGIRAELKVHEDELNKYQEELRKEGTSEDRARELQRKIEDKNIYLKRHREDKIKEVKTKEKLGLQKIENELLPILEAYTKKEKINMLISAGMEALIWTADSIDITQKIIDSYNESL